MSEQAKVERMQTRRVRPSTPGDVLADLLESNNLTITEAAHRLGVGRVTVSNLINGKRSLTPEMANRLGRFFGNGAGIWLRLQQAVDLWDCLHAEPSDYSDVQPLFQRELLIA